MDEGGAGPVAKVTIGDVARAAGVSITTVSRFINGQYKYMSQQTRERLLGVVEQLGYIPNSAAQSLKSGKSRLIGVIVTNIAHPYWSTVLSGVEEACRRLGYSAIFTSASEKPELESHYIKMLMNKQVDGLLLNPTGHNVEAISRLPALGCPVVALDRTTPDLRCDLVAMDNVYGARLAVEHLLSLGHRRIGMVSWEPRNLSNRHERLQGYTEALARAGLPSRPEDVALSGTNWGDAIRQTMALFRRKDRPTAVFAASSMLNLEVLEGLKRLGLRVPDDVSVVGYDDSPWDPLLHPPLTTVATPAHRMGIAAAKHLTKCIENGGSQASQDIRLRPRLIIRNSTGGVTKS